MTAFSSKETLALQETWLNNDEGKEELHIPGYELSINSMGKGKGIATYYRKVNSDMLPT